MFLEQAARLLEGHVRPVVLDWPSQLAIEQAAVLDLRHGIGTELPLEAFHAGSFGRCTVAGFERYRAVLDGVTVPLVKVVNGFTPQHKDPLQWLWIVPREHYVHLYRFLRRKLRKEAVENHAAPIMPEQERHRLFDNTIGFLRREEKLLARYGVPLKRGMLLIGEPGNGTVPLYASPRGRGAAGNAFPRSSVGTRLMADDCPFVILQPQPLHLLVERRAVDAQRVGGGVAVPRAGFKHFENDLPLRAFQGLLERAALERL